MKYHFVVKANESIFPRYPIKNSDRRFGIKDVKREKYPPGLQERKSLVQKQARATTLLREIYTPNREEKRNLVI
jgi:hypothetical protein